MPLASPPSQLVTGTHSVLPRRNTTCALDTHPGVHRELQSRLLAGLAPSSADRAAEVLARATTVEIEPGKPYFPASFSTAVLLVVEEGFVVVRATLPGMSRSVITCEAIANFAPTRHLDRVRRKLLQLGRSYGHVVRDGIRIDFPVSHALLAEMIGSSRETVTRALEELRSLGFVARSGSTYRLLVPAEAAFGRALRQREVHR